MTPPPAPAKKNGNVLILERENAVCVTDTPTASCPSWNGQRVAQN